jgi:epoxyqueuosine reductase
MNTDDIVRLGRELGLDAVGVAKAEPFTRTHADLDARRAAGQHAGMGFTYRDPARSTDPTRLLPGAQSIVVGARGYPAPRQAKASDRPSGRIAAYTTEDHYAPLRTALREIARRLKGEGWRTRLMVDDNGLVDREAAHRAGLGWYGKSSNLLLPGHGSWFLLGSVVTSAPLEPAAEVVPDGCGSCRRCLDGCPTGAIVAPGVVDARRCLSWLLQAPGDFPREHRAALGDRLYGCDDCQEVCPPNRRAAAPEMTTAVAPNAELLELLAASDTELLARFGRWYLPDRDPDQIRRNALLVLGNVGDGTDAETVATLERYLAHPRDLLRSHAAWAARRLGLDALLDARTSDPVVAAELAQ